MFGSSVSERVTSKSVLPPPVTAPLVTSMVSYTLLSETRRTTTLPVPTNPGSLKVKANVVSSNTPVAPSAGEVEDSAKSSVVKDQVPLPVIPPKTFPAASANASGSIST